MRDLGQFFATAVVLLVAIFCVLVQVGHVGEAVDRIQHHDGASIQQVSTDTGRSR